MSVENSIRFDGNTTDRWGGKLQGASVFFSDGTGKPRYHNDKTIGVISDVNGEWALRIPSEYLEEDAYITARMTGMPSETLKISEDQKTLSFILGGYQEVVEVVAAGQKPKPCVSIACKFKQSWKKHRKPWIAAIVLLVLLAILMTVVFSVKKNK